MAIQLADAWRKLGFQPNEEQRAAILHGGGPLFLPAGPGAGKTRVLLWRVVKLLIVDAVPPERIFLATFTEKAARQLHQGLRDLHAAIQPQQPCELSRMFVGTIIRFVGECSLARDSHRLRNPARDCWTSWASISFCGGGAFGKNWSKPWGATNRRTTG